MSDKPKRILVVAKDVSSVYCALAGMEHLQSGLVTTVSMAARANGPYDLLIVGHVDWDKEFLGERPAGYYAGVAVAELLLRQNRDLKIVFLWSAPSEFVAINSGNWSGGYLPYFTGSFDPIDFRKSVLSFAEID